MRRVVLIIGLLLLAVPSLSNIKVGEKRTETMPPTCPAEAHFCEVFGTDWQDRWQKSADKKFADGGWNVEAGTQPGLSGEKGLIAKHPVKHHAISSLFPKGPIDGSNGFVLQYEVRFHTPHICGGAYLKLLKDDPTFTPVGFKDSTPYVIMFGPDHCDRTDKVHFIFRHKSPVTGKWEEKHMVDPPKIRNDQNTHLYTLIVRTDNTYEILIDHSSVSRGSLLEDFKPPVNPKKEIDDPDDKKPKDWVDDPEMPDPEAVKPADWDETEPKMIPNLKAKKPEGWNDDAPFQIPDPAAEKPADWNDEDDGTWEHPMIDNPACEIGCGKWEPPMMENPKYKGKWHAPLVDNPAYKGPFVPRQIANPDYFEDWTPYQFQPMGAVGIEIWTMQDGVEFDNIYIGTDENAAFEWATRTWSRKRVAEEAAMAETGFLTKVGEWIAKVFRLMRENPVPSVLSVLCGFGAVGFLTAKLCCDDREADKEDEDEGKRPAPQTTATSTARRPSVSETVKAALGLGQEKSSESSASASSSDSKDNSGSTTQKATPQADKPAVSNPPPAETLSGNNNSSVQATAAGKKKKKTPKE